MKRIEKIIMAQKEMALVSSLANTYKTARRLFHEKYPEFHNGAIVSEMNLATKPWKVYLEFGGENTRSHDKQIKLLKCSITIDLYLDNNQVPTSKSKLVIHYQEHDNNVETFHLNVGERQADGFYVFDNYFLEKDCIRKGIGIEVSEYLNCDSEDFTPTIEKFCQKTIKKLNKELAK